MKIRTFAILFLPVVLFASSCQKNEPVPTASFYYSGTNSLKAPCQVQFNNFSTEAASYEWWFGSDSSVYTLDPPGSTLENPVHTYFKPGKYFVTLRAYTESRKEWATAINTIVISDTLDGGSK